MKNLHLLLIIAVMALVATACGDDDPVGTRVRPVAVDLGLSVKWANHNMGATEPELWGGLYGWADSAGIHKVDDANNPVSVSWRTEGGREITTVEWHSPYFGGSLPMENIAATSYDIARYTWGSDWRLPTADEWQELIDRCTWTVATDVKNARAMVMRVTGPNGNSILLPMTGINISGNEERSNEGHYWTASLLPRDDQADYGYVSNVACAAWAVYITSTPAGVLCVEEPQVRSFHLAVRPVAR